MTYIVSGERLNTNHSPPRLHNHANISMQWHRPRL